MSRAWRDRSDYARYRRNRAGILLANRAENQGRCTVQVGQHCPRHHHPCPGVCTGEATQVHHTKGKIYGDDPKYMIPSCKACNLHVGEPSKDSPNPKQVSNW